jgi:hypothetical protein
MFECFLSIKLLYDISYSSLFIVSGKILIFYFVLFFSDLYSSNNAFVQ